MKLLKLNTLLLAHKIVHNVDALPKFFHDKYVHKGDSCLRNNLDFVTPYYRTNLGQRSIDFSVSKEWNGLPSHLKSQHNYYTFKREVKKWLLNKEIY